MPWTWYRSLCNLLSEIQEPSSTLCYLCCGHVLVVSNPILLYISSLLFYYCPIRHFKELQEPYCHTFERIAQLVGSLMSLVYTVGG